MGQPCEQLARALLEAFPTREHWNESKGRFFVDMRKKDRFVTHARYCKSGQITIALSGIVSGCFETQNADGTQEWSAMVANIAKSILVAWQSMRHISGATLPGDGAFDFSILQPALLRPAAALALGQLE